MDLVLIPAPTKLTRKPRDVLLQSCAEITTTKDGKVKVSCKCGKYVSCKFDLEFCDIVNESKSCLTLNLLLLLTQ